MAENPVLKEAKRKGLVASGTTSNATGNSTAANSGSANPVIQQFNGTKAAERAAAQQKIIETAKSTPAVATTTTTTQQKADDGFDLAKFMVGTLGKGANAIAKAGTSTAAFLEKSLLEPLFPGITQSTPIQWMNSNVDADAAYLENKYGANRDKGGKAAQIAEDIGVGVIQAVPQAIVAAGTAGSSLAAQGLSKAASASPTVVSALRNGITSAAKSPNYWTSFLTTVGNDYESAKADGADDVHAGLYAVADSLLGAAVEVAGGIQKLPTELQGNRFTVRKWIDTMLDEGKEEVVQGVLSRGLENVVYDKGNAIASVKDENAIFNPVTSAKEFGLGAAVGGILGGVQGIGSNLAQNRAETTLRAQTVPQEGSVTPTTQNAAEGAQNAAPEAGTAGNTRMSEADLQAYLRVGERQHVRDLKQEMQRSGDSPVLTTPERVRAFISDSIVGKIRNTIKAYGQVGQRFQQDVAAKSNGNTDISGYYLELDSNRMQHLSEHIQDDGDPRNIPLTEEQVLSIPDYIDSYDDVLDVVTRKDGQTRIYLGKQINGHSVVVVLASKGRGSVQPVTAWQNTTEHYLKKYGKAKTPVDTSRYSTASGGNESGYKPTSVEGTRPLNVDSNIAQGAENVNIEPVTDAVPTGNSVGAADAGSLLPGQPGRERTSRLAETLPYNRWQEAATGMTREDYAQLFRYQSQTESRSLGLAEELLYVMKDGEKTFLLDVDPTAFRELVQSLDDATAWNAPQTDAAYMIQEELQGRSANLEIPEDAYIDWLKTFREHTTATGQGTQAHAKWTRGNNDRGQSSELDAWNTLEKSKLTDEQKRERFQKIVQWDTRIEAVPDGDTDGLKSIIMEVAGERGVVGGPFGKAFAKVADSALNSLTFDQMKQFAYSSTAALANDSAPANAGEKLKTVQILNMLSSPKTAARNLTGNTSFYALDALSMDGAAILDMAVSKMTGTRSVAMERAALGRGSLSDAAKAMQMAVAEITLDVDMGGEKTRYGTGSNRTFKASGNFVERVLSTLERNQAYLLNATDEFYKGAARGTSKATQKLVDSGKIKTTDSDYAANQAEQLAKYRTFQDDTKISTAIQEVHDLLNLVGIGDSGKRKKNFTVHSVGLGDFAAPFTRVAGNLVSRGLEYSPLNAVKGTVEIAQQVARAAGKKTVDPAAQAKGVSNAARGLTGTAIAYGFMLLAKSGLLRQAADEEDEDVAALNQSEGINGTQLNLSAAQRALSGGSTEWKYGDTLVDLASVEPLNLLMNLGTEMAKDQNPLLSMFGASTNSFMDAAVELPALSTAGNIVTDVVRYKKDAKESIAEEAGRTLISSVTPNILNAAAKGMDDRPRNTYSGDGLLDIFKDTFKNRVPGLRETLPGSVNTMGEEKLYQNGEAGIFNSMFNPIGVNTYTQSAVSQEMERVREETGETEFYPTKKIPRELTADGKTVSLDYEARQDYQRDRGAVMMTTTAEMMGSARYKAASDAEKAELLNQVHKYANYSAKANIMGNDAVPQWVLNAKTAKQDIGVSTSEYLALYAKYGGDVLSGESYERTKQAVSAGLTVDEYVSLKKSADTDGNGRTTKEEAKAALAGRANRADLWDIICTTNAKNPY